MDIDLDSVKLIASSGEAVTLTGSDFVYNDLLGVYEVTVELELPFTSVVMSFDSAPFSSGMSGIDDYIGNEMKTFEITVYEL